MKFSLFKPPITNTKPFKEVTIDNVIKIIRSNDLKNATEKVRNASSKTERDELKKSSLPFITFGGTFKERNISNIKEVSGYICIDADGLTPEDLNSAKANLSQDNYVHAYFTSPSGTGLKIIIKIPRVNAKQYTATYIQISKYLYSQYGLIADDNAKDISRATFLCHDSEAYYNPTSEVFDITLTPDEFKSGKVDYNDIITGVEEGNRNNAMFKIACSFKNKDISKSDALNFVLESNKRNKPPLPESEIITIVNSAYSYSEPVTNQEFNISNLNDLLKKDIQATEWLVENNVAESGITVIGAPPKTGKSFFGMAVMHSCCTGERFLGRYKTKKVVTLYLDLENGEATMCVRLKSMFYNVTPEDQTNAYVSIFSNIKLDDPESVKILSTNIKKYNVRLVIVDSMVRAMKGDEDKAKDVRQVFEGLKNIKLENPLVSFLILHHMSKTGSGQKGLRGSGEFSAFCDTIFTMEAFGEDMISVTCENSRLLARDKLPKFNIKIVDKVGQISLEYFEKGEKTTVIEQCKRDIVRFLSDNNMTKFETPLVNQAMNNLGHKSNAFHSAKAGLLRDKVIREIKRGEFEVNVDKMTMISLGL